MNTDSRAVTEAQIELPPMAKPQVPRIDADIDLMDIKLLAQWCERTAQDYARQAIAHDRQQRDRGSFPPYNPRLPTDAEWKNLIENGRKAWGQHRGEPGECDHCGGTGQTCTGTIDGIPELFDCHHCGGTGDVSGEYPGVMCPPCNGTGKAQPAEPVKLTPAQERIAQAVEPVKEIIENQEPLGEPFAKVLHDNAWDLYVKSTEPVKVPSDGDIMVEWASTPNTGDMRVDLVVFARALLARYGNAAQPSAPEVVDMLLRVERWMSGYGTKSQSDMRQEVRAILAAAPTPPAAGQPNLPDEIFLGCARMGMAGASDEEVLRFVRTAMNKDRS